MEGGEAGAAMTHARKGWRPAATVSTEAEGTWTVVYRPGAPGRAWMGIHIYKPGRRTGREQRSYWTGYNPSQGRLARSSDERRLYRTRPALWQAVTEALAERFGRTPADHASRLLSMLSDAERQRLLAALTEEERRRLFDVLGDVECLTLTAD